MITINLIGADALSTARAASTLAGLDQVQVRRTDTTADARPTAVWEDDHWLVDGVGAAVVVLVGGPEVAAVTGRDGRVLPDQGQDGRLYRGVQRSGFPNLFVVRDRAALSYVAETLDLMRVTEAIWVDVRQAVQTETDRTGSTSDWPRETQRSRRPWQRARRVAQVGNAGHPRRDDLWFGYAAPGLLDAAWYGPAEIELPDGTRITVQAQLTGAMQPTDGQYHWQGHIAAADGLKPGTKIVIHAGGTPAPGRVAELTPWGSLQVTGTGQPPFPLDDLEVDIPAV